MVLNINEINKRLREDAKGFISECEDAYAKKVDDAARTIAEGIRHSNIVLLSGPSGSRKTTAAMKIDQALEGEVIGTR